MQYNATLEEGIYRARLTESFTFRDNATFRELLSDIEGKPVSEVVCDLSEVDFVDSAALGMFLLLRDLAEKKQADVTLQNAAGQVQRMFEISKFSQLFNVK